MAEHTPTIVPQDLDPQKIGEWPSDDLLMFLDAIKYEKPTRNATVTVGKMQSLVGEILRLRAALSLAQPEGK